MNKNIQSIVVIHIPFVSFCFYQHEKKNPKHQQTTRPCDAMVFSLADEKLIAWKSPGKFIDCFKERKQSINYGGRMMSLMHYIPTHGKQQT